MHEEQTQKLIRELAQELKAHYATHAHGLPASRKRTLITNMVCEAISILFNEMRLFTSEVIFSLEGLKVRTLQQCMPPQPIPIPIHMGKPPRSAGKIQKEPERIYG